MSAENPEFIEISIRNRPKKNNPVSPEPTWSNHPVLGMWSRDENEGGDGKVEVFFLGHRESWSVKHPPKHGYNPNGLKETMFEFEKDEVRYIGKFD